MLAPTAANIFLFHLWRNDPFGLAIGPVLALTVAVLFGHRAAYGPMLEPQIA